MKKILLFVLAISMVVTLALPFASFAAETAVEIDSAADLAAIKDDLAGNYILTADIEGAAQIPGEFTGTLDGNGFKVSGLTEALFEALVGTVKNITVEATIDVTTTADDANTAVAVVVETAKGGAELFNVTAEGSIKANYTATGGKVYTGGIVGTTYTNYGQTISFTKCTNNATIEVTGNNKVYGAAGIIGASFQTSNKNVGTIEMYQCINNADITGINTNGSVAGLVGRFTEIKIAQDKDGNAIYEELADGVPTGNTTSDKASGRQIAETAIVIECANKGDVTVTGGTGEGSAGLFGYFRQGLISKCYNTGNITSNKGADGFISWCNLESGDDGSQNRYLRIEYSYNSGTILNTEEAQKASSLANVQNVTKARENSGAEGNCYLTGTTAWRTTNNNRPTFDAATTAVECADAAAMLAVLGEHGYVANPDGTGYPVLAFEVESDEPEAPEIPATWDLTLNGKYDIWAMDGSEKLAIAEFNNKLGTLTIDGETVNYRGTLAENNLVLVYQGQIIGSITTKGPNLMIVIGEESGIMLPYEEEEPDSGLKLGENSINVTDTWAGVETTFTAPADGKYTIKPSEGETNHYVGILDEYGITWIDLPYEIELTKGQVVGIVVSTYDMEADEINLVIEADAEIPETGDATLFIVLASILSLGVAVVALKRRQSVR